MKSYEEIRQQLIAERRKNAMMELKIREEVCTEMAEQIVEIEKNYRYGKAVISTSEMH